MSRAVLDENEVGPYTGDGGTSNNAKANANFAELYKQTLIVPLVPNGPSKVYFSHSSTRTVASAKGWRGTTALGSVGGTLPLAIKNAAGVTMLSTATIDAKALTAAPAALTLTPTGADLVMAAGAVGSVELTSNNADATGTHAIVEITYA